MRRQRVHDHAIAAIAERQGGVIARSQLLAAGLGASAVDHRVTAGRLHVVHRGVYAVGQRVLGADGRRWAAVLACGPGAVLSHRSAAAAWDLRASAAAAIDVTVGRGGRARRPGIRLHWRAAAPRDERTTLRALPITTPARTLLDLAATRLPSRQLETALDRAERLRLLDFAELRRLLARYPGRPGTPSLTAQLARFAGPADTRSHLERLVHQLCDAERIPPPQVNTIVEGRVRDFAWPARRVVVEADSYAWHRSPSALNDDRERDVELTLAGWRTLRFTYEQVTRRPAYVVQAITAALYDLTSHGDVKS